MSTATIDQATTSSPADQPTQQIPCWYCDPPPNCGRGIGLGRLEDLAIVTPL